MPGNERDDNKIFFSRMQVLFSVIALKKDLPWAEIHFAKDSDLAESLMLRQEAEKISASSAKKMNIQALRDDLKMAFPHGVQVWTYASAEEASHPWAIKDRQEYAARARLFCAAGSLVMRWVPDKKQQAIYLEALTTLYGSKKRVDGSLYAGQITEQFQTQVLDWLEKLPELSFIYRPHLAQALVYQEMHQETQIKEMQWPEDYSGDAYREAQRAVQQDIMILRAHSREQSTDYDWEYSARKRSPAQRITQPIQTSQGGISFAVTEKNAMLPTKSVRVTLAKAATNLSVENVENEENEETSLAARYAHETSGWKAQLPARTVPVVFGTLFSGGATTIGILMTVGMLSLTGWGLLGLVFCAAVTAIIVLGASYREYQSRQAVKQVMVEKPLQLEELDELEEELAIEEEGEHLTAEPPQEVLESPMVSSVTESRLDSPENILSSQTRLPTFPPAPSLSTSAETDIVEIDIRPAAREPSKTSNALVSMDFQQLCQRFGDLQAICLREMTEFHARQMDLILPPEPRVVLENTALMPTPYSYSLPTPEQWMEPIHRFNDAVGGMLTHHKALLPKEQFQLLSERFSGALSQMRAALYGQQQIVTAAYGTAQMAVLMRETESSIRKVAFGIAQTEEQLAEQEEQLAEQVEELVETKGKLAEQAEELVETKGKLAEQVKELVGIKKTNAEQAKEIEQLKQDLAERERQLKEDLRKEMRELMQEFKLNSQKALAVGSSQEKERLTNA